VFPVVGAIFLLGQAEFLGEGEGLPEALHSLFASSRSIFDQGKLSGRMPVCQKTSPSQTCFTIVGSCDEYCSPGDGMGTFSSGARKDVLKRGLNVCCVGEETPVQI
jgi:hypothetical protein